MATGLAVAAAEPAHAAPSRVRVRGTAHLEVHVTKSSDGSLVTRGVLTDDTGAPIPNAQVATDAALAEDPAHPITLPMVACGAQGRRPPEPTDERGVFCAQIGLPPGRYVIHASFAGSGLVEATSLQAPFDSERGAIVLRFDGEARVIDLGRASAVVSVRAGRAELGMALPGLRLDLRDERDVMLASAVTDDDGRARFEVVTKSLAEPGRGELRVLFAGTDGWARASATLSVERHVRVELRALDAVGARLPAGVPEDGVSLRFAVTSARGPLHEGTLEARVDGALVGAAPVRGESTPLTLSFVGERLATDESVAGGSGDATKVERVVPVALRFVPAAPWFEAPPEQVFSLPVRGPSVWHELPLILVGALACAWFFLGRRAKPEPNDEAVRRADAAPPATEADPATLPPIAPLAAGGGWVGRVVDARTSRPIEGVRARITRGDFEHLAALASAVSDRQGVFRFPAMALAGREVLQLDARLHLPKHVPLTDERVLSIALRSHRDALLERLVAWARARGRPFDAAPEPTPRHVWLHASDDPRIADWALVVEGAAFGARPVDASVHADVDAFAPEPITFDRGTVQETSADGDEGEQATARAVPAAPAPARAPRR